MSKPQSNPRSRHQIYCDIMYRGLLEIRSHTRDSDYCFVHSDHLHNIPDLLKSLDNEDLHKFYWKCMRINYDLPERKQWCRVFDSLWVELAEATEREAGYRPE